MSTQQLNIRTNKRRLSKIHTYQARSVLSMSDIYKCTLRGTNWQQRHLLRYASYLGGMGQKLNGERVNFQALPTVKDCWLRGYLSSQQENEMRVIHLVYCRQSYSDDECWP